MVSDRPRECTHLVAPRVSPAPSPSFSRDSPLPLQVARTVKFLSGVSVCRWVLSPEWIEQCEKEGQLVNEEGFTLGDPDAEAMFSMDIPTSLSRARATKFLQVISLSPSPSSAHSLSQGYWLHATASVQPSPESLREIIECAGGTVSPQSLADGELSLSLSPPASELQ